MKHFGIVEWVDFARGAVAAGEAGVMREHLVSGCPECQGLADFCEKLSSVCGRMERVPDEVVDQVRSIFRARVAEQPKRAFRIPIELIYDSFLVPAPVGLRASWQIGWQGLFRAGECSVDLRLEPELRTCRAALIGQVSNHEKPEAEMKDLPVVLKSGRMVVAETRSNRFGEFQIEYEQQNRLQLYIYLEGGDRCIQVPVKRLAADKSAGERSRVNTISGKKRS
jgi:hypothetical protein